ncbi:MAG: Di-/tripeptide transporter [Acinetobacter bereziniae]|uniref:Di-/tripeptide transporter n=1 Tax=Acinetobacter bereziniae TaxID=106648 RepID=A0A833PF33_ACIBZ|nr:MAG: Di-/tripeptide transporter [Acinetobacter bereziniae]
MIIGFIAVVGLIIGLVSLGIININPIQIATYFTITICICIALYFCYLLLFAGLNQTEKKQIIICFILLITAALFWSAFEQKPTSFNLFAQDFTDRQFFGFEIPAVWFQSINPLFIIIFAPIIAWLWVKLRKQNRDPSYITKFIIALLLTAGGFLVMSIAIASYLITQNGGTVSALWIASSLLLLTLGELCLSPVGLSTMTKLAPTIIRGQVMGLWFTASALGNLMAGLIGGHVSINEVDQLPLLFVRCVIALLLGALVLWLMKKSIRKLLNQTSTPSQKSLDIQLEKV